MLRPNRKAPTRMAPKPPPTHRSAGLTPRGMATGHRRGASTSLGIAQQSRHEAAVQVQREYDLRELLPRIVVPQPVSMRNPALFQYTDITGEDNAPLLQGAVDYRRIVPCAVVCRIESQHAQITGQLAYASFGETSPKFAPPLSSSFLDYRRAVGYFEGEVVLGPPSRIELQSSPRDPVDGVDHRDGRLAAAGHHVDVIRMQVLVHVWADFRLHAAGIRRFDRRVRTCRDPSDMAELPS